MTTIEVTEQARARLHELAVARGEPDHVTVEKVLRDIRTIFLHAPREEFEFGMENDFVKALEEEVAQYNMLAIECIAHVILEREAHPEVASEALRWLGSIDHPESRQLRLKLLETCLQDPSRWVRDGAALGLDVIGDRHAIPALKAAVAQESIQELRKDLASVLRRLEQMP